MASSGVKNPTSSYREDVVISGMAGKFPESENVYQFRDNLFKKANLITEGYHRWKSSKIDMPCKAGRMKDIFAFDTGFFGIPKRLANHMDVDHKLMLESAYEVMLDAGYHPSELAGTNTGVFIAAALSDGEYCILHKTQDDNSRSFIGATRSLVAQQISYFFRLQGPSYTNDCGCCSSMYALEHAYRSIREGICDMAIVGGASLMLLPDLTLDYIRLGIIAKDGRCKSFDKNADGHVRAETVSTLFLQKSKNARRIYAHVVHAKLNSDGYKSKDITHPSSYMQSVLMSEVYNEGKVDLSDVSFLEAHGTGTNIGDMEELTAITNVFCSQRKNALYIGSIKSIAGHSEPAAALVSVIKVLIAMECGFIPPNLNYLEPREDINALVRGQLKVVTEKTLWPNDKAIAGINSVGIAGSNGHLILRWNEKVKASLSLPQDDLPRLVCFSGRTKNGINVIWEDLSSKPLDVEFVSLLHTIFKKSISNHQFRGYQILSKLGELKRSWKEVNGGKSKLALVFNNFETHWPKFGKQLMAFPVFMETLETVRSKTVSKLNLDTVNLLATYGEETKVNQILATMTVQICLAAVLRSVGITPDTVIGMGTGDLIAAYFEGHITLNDIVHALLLLEGEKCIISANNKITSTSNGYLKDWLNSPSRKQSTLSSHAEYFGVNMNETVNFHKTIKVLSFEYETLVIGAEIEDFEHLSLIRQNSQDCMLDLVTVLGRLYENGHDLNLQNLYPKTTWPVSRGTPMISPLIKWKHDQNCDVALPEPIRKRLYVVDIDLKNEDWKFLDGHIIDGKNIFPPSAYIFLVLEALGVMKRKPTLKLKVIFEDISFVEVICLENQDNIKLVINILEGSNRFEITHDEATVVTGKLYEVENTRQGFVDLPETAIDESDKIITLTQTEVYRELRLRGYNYKGQFKSIETSSGKKKGLVKWTGNWTTYLDSLLQLLILHLDTRNLYLPVNITQVIINPVKYSEVSGEKRAEFLVPMDVYHNLGIIRAEGIELRGLKAAPMARQEKKTPVLEFNKFVPYATTLPLIDGMRVMIEIITENSRMVRFKIGEVPGESQLLSPLITQLVDDLPQTQVEVTVFSELGGIAVKDTNVKKKAKENLHLLILTGAFENGEVIQDGVEVVRENSGYILTREPLNSNVPVDTHRDLDVDVLCVYCTEFEKLVLLRASQSRQQPIAINVSNDLSWLSRAQGVIKQAQTLVLYSQNEFISGILGLVHCLRREPHGDCVSCFFIIDDAPIFDPNHPFYKKQIRKRMVFNVWKEGKWGSYTHLLLDENVITRCSFCYANVTIPGDLNSISFIQGNKYNTHDLAGSLKIIHVYWSSLNFRDILRVTGRIPVNVGVKNPTPRDQVLGLEFSGRDVTGKRVMGLTPKGALATQTVTESSMIWTVPDDWSLENAATVPGTYLTVIYALLMKVKIKTGQYILIHFGNGSVSQAAINIALHFGCIIFITVDTEEEMFFLHDNYPQIKESHIGFSRDSLFEEKVLQETKNQGIDIVLHTTTLKEFSMPIHCIARQGDFFEIDNYGQTEDTKLKTKLFQYGINFHNVLLESLITSMGVSASLSRHFSDLLHQGAIKPISRIAFKMEQVGEGFELMATSKYIGKILVNIRKEEEEFACTDKDELFSALPRFYCDPKGTYIIIGGLGGFGLQLANWLVSRGARKLVLNARTGLKTGYQAMMLRLLRSYDAHVSLRTDDVTIKEGCTELITYANSLGPVKAIFNLAVVLKDALFGDQTPDSFKVSLAPKAIAAQNLDTISRIMCPELRCFVVFSSGSCGRGNTMQSNYGFANSVMERICEKRKAEGFPALAIQWGLIGDVGALVAIQEKSDKDLNIAGTFPQTIHSCLQILDKFLLQDETIVGSIIVAEKNVYSRNNVLGNLLNILGIKDLTKVNLHLGLAKFGMNSIVNAEIKQVLETELEVFLSSDEINTMTLANLQDMAMKRN